MKATPRIWEKISQKKNFGLPVFFLCLILIGGQVAILSLTWRLIPPQIPIFYSRPWGEEQISSKISLLILPLLSAAVLFVNSFLGNLSGDNAFGKNFLAYTSLGFAALNLIAIVQIVRLTI